MKEAFNNCAKYSGCTTFNYSILRTENGKRKLIMKDNGKGFDPAKRRKGVGISNMTNRVESFNCEMKITSSPGNGCRIDINIPFS